MLSPRSSMGARHALDRCLRHPARPVRHRLGRVVQGLALECQAEELDHARVRSGPCREPGLGRGRVVPVHGPRGHDLPGGFPVEPRVLRPDVAAGAELDASLTWQRFLYRRLLSRFHSCLTHRPFPALLSASLSRASASTFSFTASSFAPTSRAQNHLISGNPVVALAREPRAAD